MSRFHDLLGIVRPASLAVAATALTAVAVVALATGVARPAAAQTNPSFPPSSAPITAPSATPVVPVSPAPTKAPVVPATPAPTKAPTPAATADPSAEPPGKDAMPIFVELETSDRHDVSVDIVDGTGWLASAVSGRPGDGASVEGFTLHVENVDARSLRLTWIDFAMDNQLALFVDDVDGHIRLALVQPAPTAPVDAMGADRVLVLTFDRPVDAASVEAILQDGLDTPG